MSADFQVKFQSFLTGCQTIVDNAKVFGKPLLHVEEGRRYIKIVRRDTVGTHGSVFAFVDKQNGDVLKPATFRAPAKHARGNVFDPANGLQNMAWTGPAYLR